MSSIFSGVMTALVTPFTSEGQVDEAAMRQLVEWQIESGINGLVVCGSTGEAATLTDEEYAQVVSLVVEAASHRVPVVAGAGSNNTERAIELSKMAQDAGVDGLLQVTPFYNKPTAQGLIAHFKAIAEAVDLPIIAYNVPGRTGQNMTADTCVRLNKSVPQVIAVKEASGSIEQVMAIRSMAPEDFLILSGDDALTLPMIAVGGDGLISVASNEIPAEMTEMVRLAREGDYQSARQMHYRWFDLMNINFIETNPQPVKTALSLMGRIEDNFRLPLVAMEADNIAKLKNVLVEKGLIDE